jgi:hypothetical protein
MSNKQMTAVEWLMNELTKIEDALKKDRIDGFEYTKQKHEAYEQAKTLHKQEVIILHRNIRRTKQ